MYVEQPDQILLQRYSQFGDEHAFSEIVRRYAGLVYTSSKRVLHDACRAEDVTQETFLRLMRKPDAVTTSLGGWLHKAATQLSIDVIRSETCRRAREVSYAEEPANADSDGESLWSEVSPVVDEALAELPDDARGILIDYFIKGRSQAELAQGAGTSISTISRRVHHALELLRTRLRTKGVVVGAVALADMLALDAAEAATVPVPTTLATELGKMSMVSGTHGALARPPITSGEGHGYTVDSPLHVERWVQGVVFAAVLVCLVLAGILHSWRTPTQEVGHPYAEEIQARR